MGRLNRIALCVLVAGALAVGCTDSRKSASDRLASAVDQGQRMLQSSVALLAQPAAPPTTAATASAGPTAAVTEALGRLGQAQALLEQALRDNAGAAPAQITSAQAVLGSICEAIGDAQAQQAEDLRLEAQGLRAAMRDSLMAGSRSAAMAKFLQAVKAAPRDQIGQTQQQVAARLAAVQAQVGPKQQAIDAQQKTIDTLTAANATLSRQAAPLRDQAAAASGQASLDLLAKAHDLERQIINNAGDIATAHDRQDMLRLELEALKTEAAALTAQQQAVAQVAQDVTAKTDALDAEIAQVQAQTKAQTDALKAQVGQLRALQDRMLKLETDALAAYENASTAFQASKGGAETALADAQAAQSALASTARQAVGVALSQVGTVALEAGQVRLRQLQAQRANQRLADHIKAMLPEQADDALAGGALSAYPPAAADVLEKAVADFGAADNTLTKALKEHYDQDPDRNTRWILQAQLASAYYGLSMLKDDASVRAAAASLVDEALKDKIGSPYLQSVMRLKMLLEGRASQVQ